MQIYIGAVFWAVTLAHTLPPQHVGFPSPKNNGDDRVADVVHFLDPRGADFQRNISIAGLSASASAHRPFVK